MSAQLAGASASFTYNGASIALSCGSAEELRKALASFGIGAAANDTASTSKVITGKGATAPAGATASQTAAPSAQTAAAQGAGEAGNVTSTGSGAPASPGAVAGASSSGPASAPAVTFDVLKKAFLGLSTKPGGRALCEGVLAPFKLAKLSEATEAQYAAILAAIEQAAK